MSNNNNITQSAVKCFLNCPRKYFYSYEALLKAENENVVALQIGSAVHAGVETYLNGGTDAEVEAALRKYHSDDDQVAKNLAAVAMFRKNIRLSAGAKVKTEIPFTVKLNSDWTLSGKIDQVYEITAKNLAPENTQVAKKLALGELKTASLIDQDYKDAARSATNLQIGLYSWALEQTEFADSRKVASCLYVAIKKPLIRQKKAETLQDFKTRLEDWYNTAGGEAFWHEMVRITDEAKEESVNTVLETIENIERSRERNRFQQNPGACNMWNRRCSFFGLCNACPKFNPKQMLKTAEVPAGFQKKAAAHEELA